MARFSLDGLDYPIVQAPLSGGPATPALAAAVSGAGGLGFLAAGYKDVDAVAGELEELRSLLGTDLPFGVNLFADPGHGADSGDVGAYAERLRGEAERVGAELGEPRWDDDRYEGKLDLLCAEGVPVVSFTFGCPPAADVARIQESGASVWVTVTTPREAEVASATGADALVLQGVDAGGHRGGFDDAAPGEVGLLALLELTLASIGDGLPLVATGGIMTCASVAAVLTAGASAAQLGTAFLLCPETGTSAAHRDAISRGDAPTRLTRAFTGRTARGILNRFMREHDSHAPSAYPEVHHLTAPLRAAAREQGEADAFHLWAGQAYALAEPAPAADLVVRIGSEARAALHRD